MISSFEPEIGRFSTALKVYFKCWDEDVLFQIDEIRDRPTEPWQETWLEPLCTVTSQLIDHCVTALEQLVGHLCDRLDHFRR